MCRRTVRIGLYTLLVGISSVTSWGGVRGSASLPSFTIRHSQVIADGGPPGWPPPLIYVG